MQLHKSARPAEERKKIGGAYEDLLPGAISPGKRKKKSSSAETAAEKRLGDIVRHGPASGTSSASSSSSSSSGSSSSSSSSAVGGELVAASSSSTSGEVTIVEARRSLQAQLLNARLASGNSKPATGRLARENRKHIAQLSKAGLRRIALRGGVKRLGSDSFAAVG